MALSIAQESKQVHEGWWEWAVWLEGPAKEIDEVKSVEWILHPTFPKPVRRVSTRNNGFRLKSAGWGEFMIRVQIHDAEGRILKKRHWLQLKVKEDAPEPQAPAACGDAKPQPRRLFVSSSVSDAPLAHLLAAQLQTEGFEVLTPEDVRPGTSFQAEGDRLTRAADGAVVLMSGTVTPWMEQELAALRQRSVPIMPVFIGAGARVPEQLADLRGIRLKGGSEKELRVAMKTVGQRIMKMIL